eukprot:796308-Ditylum_brightwellii.AAC.1
MILRATSGYCGGTPLLLVIGGNKAHTLCPPPTSNSKSSYCLLLREENLVSRSEGQNFAWARRSQSALEMPYIQRSASVLAAWRAASSSKTFKGEIL